MTTITFNPLKFAIANTSISSEETRYYLIGVCVQAHAVAGVTMTATDGHTLVSVYDESAIIEGDIPGEGFIVYLNKATLAAACKIDRASKKESSVIVDTVAKTATIVSAGGAVVAMQPNVIVDGHFPDWRRVVPAIPEKPVNANFGMLPMNVMTSAAKAVKAAGGAECLTIYQNGENPAFVALGCDFAFGVIMPMRTNIKGYALRTVPGWYLDTPKQSEAA